MTLREIVRYAGTLYGANALASLITLGITVMLGRDLSRADLGLYGLFQVYFLFGSYATSAGLPSATVKWVAGRTIDDGEFLHFIVVRLLVIAVVLYASAAVAVWLGDTILGAALFALPAFHVFNITLSAARARLKRRTEAGLLVAASLATSLWMFVLLADMHNEWAAIGGQVIGAYTTALVVLVVALRWKLPRPKRPGNWRAAFWRTARPVFLGSTVFALGDLADRVLVQHMLGLKALGTYVMALMLFGVLNKPVHMLSRVLLSHFSQAAGRVPDAKAGDIVRLNLFTLPFMALMAAAALPWLLPFVVHRNYAPAFPVLAVMTAVILVKAFELVHSTLAVARDSAASNLRAQCFALFVYAALIIPMVRGFGLLGVAWAVVLRWLALAIFQRRDMLRRGVQVLPMGLLARAGAVYMAALALFPVAPWWMGITYLVGGAVARLWSIPQAVSLVSGRI
ncbi:MAG: hypothetical protein M0Z76_01825 [Gammaproteobacteria bacterium]|nr:hypothetical protein [Gammaproteobacteria bacterium]